MAYWNMAYWNSSETSITLSGLKRNGMSRSNVRGLVAFCKVFRSDRLTNLIPGYTTRSVCCTLSPPSSRLPPICRCFPFSPLVCSASPLLFSLFFSSPFPFFCARVCVRGNFKARKTDGKQGKGWRVGSSPVTLLLLLPFHRALRLLARLCDARRDETRRGFEVQVDDDTEEGEEKVYEKCRLRRNNNNNLISTGLFVQIR